LNNDEQNITYIRKQPRYIDTKREKSITLHKNLVSPHPCLNCQKSYWKTYTSNKSGQKES